MNPFIVLKDTAGVTEAGFTGERDDDGLVGMVRTDIFGVTEFMRVAAGEHFVDGIDGIIRNGIEMFSKNRIPVVLKDFSNSDIAC